jgi:CBS domain-containing protein
MKVQELMTKKVAACRADDACNAAVKLMWDCDCGAVPVVGNDEKLAGMITDRDVCIAAWAQDRSPSAIPVSSVMSRDLCVCSPSDSVESAERLMRSRKVRRVPVIDAERRLVGILSLADVVRAADNGRGGRKAVAPDEVAATLADICQPRQDGQTTSLQA